MIIYLADSSSGLGTLGVSGSAFVIQLITFLLAFWVLKRFAFGPIGKILKERKETIEQGVSLGEKMKNDAKELEDKIEEELTKARTKADDILEEAKEASKKTIKEAEDEAYTKAEDIILEAKDKAKMEMENAKKKLENEIAELVVEATEVLTKEKIDKSKDAKLIDQAISEVKA